MAIVYAVTKCKNPKYPDTDYLSCKARNTGTYDFDDLAEDIAESTTVTKADAMVLINGTALKNVMFIKKRQRKNETPEIIL